MEHSTLSQCFHKARGMWWGGHLLSPPANLNKPDQINARWWLCIHWASAHVHKCMYNFSTATPQARKAWKLSGNKCAVSIDMSKRFHSPFGVWSRALTQQVSSSNCCRSLVKCFSCQHYNDGAERRRERKWWDAREDETARRLNGSVCVCGGGLVRELWALGDKRLGDEKELMRLMG